MLISKIVGVCRGLRSPVLMDCTALNVVTKMFKDLSPLTASPVLMDGCDKSRKRRLNLSES